jgi:hypothetical protein
MPISTMGGVTAVVDGKIYAIGGNHKGSEPDNNPTSEVQVYDSQLDSWEIVGDCPVDFYDGTGIAYNGSIFLPSIWMRRRFGNSTPLHYHGAVTTLLGPTTTMAETHS